VAKALARQDTGDVALPPWANYATAAKAKATIESGMEPTLALKLASAFGFESDRKDGSGAKRGDHRLSPGNNFSERMPRFEKLIENSALFRQTLEGRFALDIVLTVLQAAVAAKVDLQLYLMWVLSMPPEVVDHAPAEFTSHAFARLYSRTAKQT
jgi:hypothetical protein